VRSELDHLKSEAISKPVNSLTCSTIVGGDDEGQSLIVPTIKNIAKSDSQSENVFASNISIISESSNSLRPYLVRRKNIEDIEKINDDDGIIPIPKLSDSQNEDANASETNNSETSKDIMLDTHINSDPQISVGGIEAIPIVASTLMSSLSAYMLLILIIGVIWFVVFRREWGIGKKSERLRNM
jgi:hypothetical protein